MLELLVLMLLLVLVQVLHMQVLLLRGHLLMDLVHQVLQVLVLHLVLLRLLRRRVHLLKLHLRLLQLGLQVEETAPLGTKNNRNRIDPRPEQKKSNENGIGHVLRFCVLTESLIGGLLMP